MSVRRYTDEYPEEGRTGRRLLIAALALIPLGAMTGVAIDYGMTFMMRQKLDAVAQSALASALAHSRALRDGRSDVSVDEMESKGRGRADLVFNAQKPNLRDIRTTFTLSRHGAENVFDARVTYTASVNTVFLRFAGVQDLELEGEATTTWVARDALIDDRFDDLRDEVIAAGRKSAPAPSDWISSTRTKLRGAPVVQLAAAVSYTGAPPPSGVNIAMELDTADGNVFVSKKVAIEPGSHQLRYWYKDRQENEYVAPAWLCGTREEDIEWMSARDRSATGDTSRMSVYLNADTGGAAPQPAALGASTRIDSCYSSGHRWIQRTIKIDILSRGDYWLTFRGEGRSDGTGAAVANILLCREPCSDGGADLPPPSTNYPWRPGDLLFEDRFVTAGPSVLAPPPAEASGWKRAPNWVVWPGRAVKYTLGQGASSGFVELDAPSGEGFENQRMGRPFLFTPGFYQLRYSYSVGPNSPHKAVACNYFGLEAALQRVARVVGADTHRVNVVIDPDRPYLHPEQTGADEQAKTGWYSAEHVLDRDSTGLKRQMLPDMTNAVDFCAGAPPNVTTSREVTFRIDKAGYYWITFAAEGPADGEGGRISAVQLLAVGPSFSGQTLPRIIRSSERGDITTPPVGSLLIHPPGAVGQRPLYRVQVQ